jgi:hypothetical protein
MLSPPFSAVSCITSTGTYVTSWSAEIIRTVHVSAFLGPHTFLSVGKMRSLLWGSEECRTVIVPRRTVSSVPANLPKPKSQITFPATYIINVSESSRNLVKLRKRSASMRISVTLWMQRIRVPSFLLIKWKHIVSNFTHCKKWNRTL